MSFVLDALKVSEQRRSRFSRRIYAHPPRPRRPGRGRKWLVMLGLPAIAALAVLGWRLLAPAPGPLPPPPPAAAQSASVPLPGAPPAENPANDSRPAAGVEHKNTFQDPAPAAVGASPKRRQDRSGLRPAPGFAMPDSGERRSVPEPARNVVMAPPPDWPALSLQMVFFSEQENRSFVQVNGKTYRQGEKLAAGPQVLRITPDGVTLAHRGQRILLGAER